MLEAGRDLEGPALAWALEDAWRNPLVLRCWTRFARQVDAATCERIVLRATQLRIGAGLAQVFDDLHQATDGWALETAGYVDARAGSGDWRTRAAANDPPAVVRRGRAVLLALPVT